MHASCELFVIAFIRTNLKQGVFSPKCYPRIAKTDCTKPFIAALGSAAGEGLAINDKYTRRSRPFEYGRRIPEQQADPKVPALCSPLRSSREIPETFVTSPIRHCSLERVHFVSIALTNSRVGYLLADALTKWTMAGEVQPLSAFIRTASAGNFTVSWQ
jgi:hypothetical protein